MNCRSRESAAPAKAVAATRRHSQMCTPLVGPEGPPSQTADPALTHLSLFSGIGGLDLAAEWAGFTSVGQCEWADFPTKILEQHWPDVPKWRDIHDLTGEDFRARTGLRTVDVISGGFPCQPFSVAGKQEGKEDERYLWPEMLRVIADIRPRFVVGENVPGILQIAASDVVESLEREGYECVLFDFEAASVGAPHRRERIAFVAHRKSGPVEDSGSIGCIGTGVLPEQPWGTESERTSEAVADALRNRSQTRATNQERRQEGQSTEPFDSGETVAHAESRRQQRRQRSWEETRRPCCGRRWPVEPDMGRVANGVPDRVDRIKALGNAVVPPQFYPIFKAIAEELRRVDA